MMKNSYLLVFLFAMRICSVANAQLTLTLENQNFRIIVDKANGALSSFLIKKNRCDLVREKRLMANFRICLQSHNDLDNYIDGMKQVAKSVTKHGNAIIVVFSGMRSPNENYPISLTYWITLAEDHVSFKAKLINNDKDLISEFWFPCIGGIEDFGNRDAKLATPGYNVDCQNNIAIFKNFPGAKGLGSEAAEWSGDYPGSMCMPWWDIYDQDDDLGLYLGYHDTICRFSTWHMYLWPDRADGSGSWPAGEQLKGAPVGIEFSHVLYPFIHSGETFESGEFIVWIHGGDWHEGSQFYRKWFISHFSFDKSKSWLRKQSSWFSSVCYQPEDRIVTNFKGFDQWAKDAKKYGVGCYELLGWDKGGIDRNYPAYEPSKRLGGLKGFKSLLGSIKNRGNHCLVFVNYNMLDQNTGWYKNELYKYLAQDQFGNASWVGYWGESTLLARKGMSARHIARSSISGGMENILDNQLLPLVRDGAQGFQMDKVVAGYGLDFNPLNTMKPDVALCEGLVDAISRLSEKCKAINPEFCMAAEFGLDRLIPYFDVGYRNSSGYGISPLKYVFPEWTSCQHVSAPGDIRSVNGAVLTGSVIVLEPDCYQGTLNQPLYHDLAMYVQEVTKIRQRLASIIFLGKYLDNLGAKVVAVDQQQSWAIHYKVWEYPAKDEWAIVVANDSPDAVQFQWKFTDNNVKQATLYEPFSEPGVIKQGEPLTLNGLGLQVIVLKID
jgi:Domain of unknown function (DUF6259)